MPRYIIDTDDGLTLARDDNGSDFLVLEAARREAVIALPEIACGAIGRGNFCPITSSIRDEARTVLFEATLSLSELWVTNPRTQASSVVPPHTVGDGASG